MKAELQKAVYKDVLTYPTRTNQEHADSLGVSVSTIKRAKKKLLLALDYEIARSIAGKFLADFQQASDYFKLQIERLEELKDKEKTVFFKGPEGQSVPKTVPLEAMDLLAIEKHQTELWKDIVFLARQSEAVEIIKGIQDGRIKSDSQAMEFKDNSTG
jgi:hypothetical protein